jgi:hypothetical protein
MLIGWKIVCIVKKMELLMELDLIFRNLANYFLIFLTKMIMIYSFGFKGLFS